MTLEASLHGYSHWRLPSPSSTPEASVLRSPPLRTPRTACSISFDADTFNTPRPNGQETPAQTPLNGTFVAAERLANRPAPRHRLPEDARFHTNHPVGTATLQLPPVSPGRRLSSSPSSSSFAPDTVRNAIAKSLAKAQGASPMKSFEMQTPPPTRDASSRQKAMPPHMATLGTPASNTLHAVQTTPGNAGSMQPPPTMNVQTPFQFDALQFSPNDFGFLGSGPASAPVYPQSRLFWDPNSSQHGMDIDMSHIHDPFGPHTHTHSPTPVWPSVQHQVRMEQQNAQQVPFATPQPQPYAAQPSNQTFWSPGDVLPRNTAPFTSPIRSVSAFAAGPDAVSAFSSPPQTISGTVQPSQIQISHAPLQPFEHQTQAVNRTQSVASSGQQQHARTNTGSSTASTLSSTRTGLQRSNTDSGTRRRLNNSTESRLSASSVEQQIMRKPSPLKRNSQHSQTSLSAIPESVKPAARTRLVIDENGTARTEVVRSGPFPDSRRRSGIWDLESDSDTDEEDMVPSRRSSFVFTGDATRRAKQPRMDNTAEPSKVARSGSSSSLSKLSLGIRRTASSTSRRGTTKMDTRRSSAASFEANSFASDGAERSWEMEGIEAGGAQLALKKVIEDKLKRQEKSPEEKLAVHNQRWSLASADIAKLQPFTFDRPGSSSVSQPSVSPNSNSYIHDSTASANINANFSHSSIRCICQYNQGNGAPMVQCEHCRQWLHAACVFSGQPASQSFICPFCTGFTPSARGGRARDPIHEVQLRSNHISPLARRGNNNIPP